MNKNVIIIIAAVVIMVVAGATVAFLSSKKTESESTGQPQVSLLDDAQMAGIPDVAYKEIAKLSRENIGKAKLEDGSFVKETEEEKKQPIMPEADIKRVIDRGFISVYAEWCGYDWQNKSFFPFMQNERSKEKWSEKQLAYIGLMHGVSMGVLQQNLKSRGECPADTKEGLAKFLVQ